MEPIVLRIEQLLKHKELNNSQLAELLGYNSSEKISRLFRVENAKPSFDIVADIANKFADLNIEWLITGKGDMLKSSVPASRALLPGQQETVQHKEVTFHVVEDRKSNTKFPTMPIPITDIHVAAGEGIYNTDYVANVDSVRLPTNLLKKNATYLCVRIKGESMSPTLQDGGYMIIRLLEKEEWNSMQDERIYVVSTTEGKAFLKRVKNRFKQGFIVMMSDNPDKATYGNFNLTTDEINTIWYAEWYLSAKMPNIHDQYYSRLQRLEDRLENIEKRLV
ncbi:MAG: helix-turn-helix transcriptional regulator [Niastella sp.]|nr:helix-turn-helix transcriptional regulator [Niastella sp.]